jgi:hypothetical protein
MIETVEIEPAARELLDQEALSWVEVIVRRAESHAARLGVQFKRAQVRHWQSLEDLSIQDAVIEILVDGPQDSVDEYWDALSNLLGELTKGSSSPAAERLFVSVRRR